MKRLMLACVLLAVPLAAAATTGGRAALDAFLDGLVTLRADFTQEVQTSGGGASARGVLYLHRPDRFRWEYHGDAPQVIVADGDRVWVHDIELDQVSHKGQTSALRGTPAQVLLERAAPERFFELHDLGEQAGLAWLELIPKDKESQFERIRLGFADSELRNLVMLDKFGQATRFSFRDVERNPDLDPALFRFNPPSGIDLFGDY